MMTERNNSTVRIIGRGNAFEDKVMSDEEIIEKLLNGASLRTFMIPDSSIPSNYPEHIESYDLPHIVINGNYFWAKSATGHFFHTFGKENAGICAFCYTNIDDIFAAYTPANNGLALMNKRRYKVHRWSLKEDYRLIWDSEKHRDNARIKKGNERCSKFRIAMLDSENIWNIHPVELPMYYPETGTFQLRTAMDEYPFFFRYQAETNKILSEQKPFFDQKPDNVLIDAKARSIYTFYFLNSDGTYYNFYDIQRETDQKYKRLKIFMDNNGGGETGVSGG